MHLTMDEGASRFWTALFGAITALALIIGGMYSIRQYRDGKEIDQHKRRRDRANTALQVNNAKFETQKPFYSRQLELCELASSAAAILATPKARDRADLKKAEGEFWRLYWGPLGIVEKSGVE